MSRLERIFANLLDRLLTIIHLRRGRKRKRVTMRYLMLLSMAVCFMPCIDLILNPIA